MKRAPKRVVDAAASLAAFAVSCHEELVRYGAHAPGMPPYVTRMAEQLGVTPEALVARGQSLAWTQREHLSKRALATIMARNTLAHAARREPDAEWCVVCDLNKPQNERGECSTCAHKREAGVVRPY